MIAKIAFLFLTIDGIHHESYWHDFFKGYEDYYSIYIHSKNKFQSKSLFKAFVLPTKVPTTWRNTMNAQIELLRYALQDPANEKFIFLSETTIPLTDFHRAYKQIFSTEKSIFSFKPNPHRGRECAPINKRFHYKNPQWVVLNREHAQLMANDKVYLAILTRYPFDNEHYPSTFLAIHNLLSEVKNQDATFVFWQNRHSPHPYMFTNLNNWRELQLVVQAINRKYLFARKFAKDCNFIPLEQYLIYRTITPPVLSRKHA